MSLQKQHFEFEESALDTILSLPRESFIDTYYDTSEFLLARSYIWVINRNMIENNTTSWILKSNISYQSFDNLDDILEKYNLILNPFATIQVHRYYSDLNIWYDIATWFTKDFKPCCYLTSTQHSKKRASSKIMTYFASNNDEILSTFTEEEQALARSAIILHELPLALKLSEKDLPPNISKDVLIYTQGY